MATEITTSVTWLKTIHGKRATSDLGDGSVQTTTTKQAANPGAEFGSGQRQQPRARAGVAAGGRQKNEIVSDGGAWQRAPPDDISVTPSSFCFRSRRSAQPLDLEAAQRLAERAGSPQQQLRFIHVAGTNGKGSTCAMLDSIYRAAGWRVGLYTSPHLVSFRERIQVDRAFDSRKRRRAPGRGDETVARRVSQGTPSDVLRGRDRHGAAPFRGTGLRRGHLGNRARRTARCDQHRHAAGQRHHQRAVRSRDNGSGDTLEKIATEKAGIIKPGVPVITAADGPEALKVLRETAARLHAPLHVHRWTRAQTHRRTSLRGAHQTTNAALAVRTVEVVRGAVPFNNSAIERGLSRGAVAGTFSNSGTRPRRPWCSMARTIPPVRARWRKRCGRSFPDAPHFRARRAGGQELGTHLPHARAARRAHPHRARQQPAHGEPGNVDAGVPGRAPRGAVSAVDSVVEALAETRRDEVVVITGSLYLVGEAMELLGLGHAAHERALNEWTVSVAQDKRH